MTPQRIQGLVFSIAALLVAAASFALTGFNQQTELIVLAALILLLGVPHGALDTIFARQLYSIHTLLGWACFAGVYILLSFLVVGLWLLAPILFLVLFLAISLSHFSGDPAAGTPALSRILYGGAIIFLPTLYHGPEVVRLFSFLVGMNAASLLEPWLQIFAWPWLIALAVASILSLRNNWLTAVEIISVGLLAALTPPLISFTLFFCAMHSARHILRTLDYSGCSSPRLLLMGALFPMLGVLTASAATWYFFRSADLDATVIRLIFVGLAALTVPHMVLVERVRFSGWIKGAVKR